MPSYKTHSILALKKINKIESYVELNKEDIKTYAIGPDTLITTDYKVFDYQHAHKVKDFFLYLITTIKKEKLYNDSEIMAFLYAQIDHYILDCVSHPLIYYFTQNENKIHLLDNHTLLEMEIDNYICKKYKENIPFYYHKRKINSQRLKELIDKTYSNIYNCTNASFKYEIGMNTIYTFDDLIRRNIIKITPQLVKILNLGNIYYKKSIKNVLPYMNFKHNVWKNPETGKELNQSMIDLFNNASILTLETIIDINNYIYNGKQLSNRFINEDISYNTNLPCEKGQTFRYIRKK